MVNEEQAELPLDENVVVPFRSSSELRAATSALLQRYQLARQAGITFSGERDLYHLFGYERVLTTADYCDRYARGGLAKRIIECLAKATWRGGVELVEDEDPKTSTPFEKACDDLNTRLHTHAYLERADVLSQLSYYSVLLIGASDENLEAELPKGNGTPDKINYLQPYAAGSGPRGAFNRRDGVGITAAFGDATIQEYEVDPKSNRFGWPSYYQLRRTDIPSAFFTSRVHWSRVIHLAEGCLDNDVFGVPALECVWNLLDDLDKVTGGGSESYFQKAKAGLHLDIDKTMGLGPPGSGGITPTELAKQRDNLEEYKHNITTFLTTRGTTVKELGGSPADFASQADTIITQIAGTKGIPKRVLTGSEMGELASSQDRENFRDIVNGRQNGYVTPYVMRRFYDRLIEYNYLPKPKQYEVRWAHIQTLTEQEKADGAAKWATVNSTQGYVVFTEDEIREKWYQLEPLTDEQNGDSLSELDKARGAMLWAGTNKSMGVTVFTDDEIRDKWEDMPPLPEADKKPIAAPERFSGQVSDGLKQDQKLLNAESSSIASALDIAIATGKAALQEDELRAAMHRGDKEHVTRLLTSANETVARVLQERLRALADFEEAKHPRNEKGQFSSGGGGSSHVLSKPSSAYTPVFAEGRDSHERYTKDGQYTPERRQLHEAIVEKYLKGTTPVASPVATVLGGGPASGKSSVMAGTPPNTVHIDVDQIRGDLPEYREAVGKDPNISPFVHEEASHIGKMLSQRAIDSSRNILLDGTGDSSINKLGGKTAAMRAGGHEVIGQYVSLPTDLAVRLMKERGDKTGRYVPEAFLRETHAAVSRTFPEAVRQGLFDRATLHDTSIFGKPRLVASSVGKHLTIHDEALWNVFIAKGHK